VTSNISSSIVEELNIGDFSVIVITIVEGTVIEVVISSGLEVVTLLGGRVIDFEDFLEESDFFFEVRLFVIELIGGLLEIGLSLFQLSLEVVFLRAASINVGLVLSDEVLESGNLIGPSGEFLLVDFDFVFESSLQVSGSRCGADFIFLRVSNLVGDSLFKFVEDFEEFSANITPVLSSGTLESI